MLGFFTIDPGFVVDDGFLIEEGFTVDDGFMVEDGFVPGTFGLVVPVVAVLVGETFVGEVVDTLEGEVGFALLARVLDAVGFCKRGVVVLVTLLLLADTVLSDFLSAEPAEVFPLVVVGFVGDLTGEPVEDFPGDVDPSLAPRVFVRDNVDEGVVGFVFVAVAAAPELSRVVLLAVDAPPVEVADFDCVTVDLEVALVLAPGLVGESVSGFTPGFDFGACDIIFLLERRLLQLINKLSYVFNRLIRPLVYHNGSVSSTHNTQ